MALVDDRRCHVDVNGAYLQLIGYRFHRRIDTDAEPRRLSRRELEIVGLVALGHSGPEIAAELRIAHDTVRAHIRNAMVKAGARSRAHLVARALGDGSLAP